MYFVVLEYNGISVVKQGFNTPEDAFTFVTENYPNCDYYAINEQEV